MKAIPRLLALTGILLATPAAATADRPPNILFILTDNLGARITELATQPARREHLRKEMQRFLPAAIARDTVEKDAYWNYLTGIVEDLGRKAPTPLASAGCPPTDDQD